MAAPAPKAAPPISTARLQQIASEACDQALVLAEAYTHNQTDVWNNTIISKVLESLIAATSNLSTKYKFAVNSTIIQHLEDSVPTGTGTQTTDEAAAQTSTGAANGVHPEGKGAAGSIGVSASKGRRGMHCATGAYWNNETDGMWNFKYEGGDAKGMDVVVSIIWVAV